MNAEARSAQFLGFLWVFLAILVAGCFALGFKRFAAEVPWSWEKRLHRLVGPLGRGELCVGTPAAEAAAKKLIARIFPIYPSDNALPLHVEFVRDPRINAFAAFAGHVYVNSGLLAQSESGEELAGVIAHEIAHVSGRDVIAGALIKVVYLQALNLLTGVSGSVDARLANLFFGMRFTREQEEDADEAALKRLRDAEVDSRPVAALFHRLSIGDQIPAWLSDHPAPDERYRRFNESNGAVLPALKNPEWDALRAFCEPTKLPTK